MTAAIPITTPSRVKAERSLFAHSDWNAIRMASTKFMKSGLRSQVLGLRKTTESAAQPWPGRVQV